MERKAVITGLGFVTSIGNSQDEVVESLLQLRSGIVPIPFAGTEHAPVEVAGAIRGFDVSSPNPLAWKLPPERRFPRATLRSLAPHGAYALYAIEEALENARFDRDLLRDTWTGLYAASAGSGQMTGSVLRMLDESEGRRAHPLGIVSSIAGTLNFNLGAHYGIRGSNVGFVSACASSAHALGYALDDIRLGRQTRALVVGAEDLSRESVLPFAYMRTLSSDADARASRPFDATRNGFVISGGAVALLVEEEDTARARGAPILARVRGWGQAADGHDIAISHPEGEGLRRAMQNALRDARLQPDDIDYLNAHATSTPTGDRSEAIAIRHVFDGHLDHLQVSSTKGLTGHPLSMSGAMEAAFTSLMLHHQFVAGNAHLSDPDPDCDPLILPRTSTPQPIRLALSNSSGFGGSNVSLVLEGIE